MKQNPEYMKYTLWPYAFCRHNYDIRDRVVDRRNALFFYNTRVFFSVNFKNALEVNNSLRKFKVAEHNLVDHKPLPFIGVLFMSPYRYKA